MASRIVPILNDVQSVIGFRFKDVQFLWEALQVPVTTFRSSKFTAVGPIRDEAGIKKYGDSNKRLAVLGDTVLKTVLLEDWYHKGHSGRFIDPILQEVASNYNLNAIGRTHQLDTLIQGTGTSTVKLSSQYVADTVEAILGVAYLDDVMMSVRKVMSNLGLESKAFHQAKFTEDGHFSQGQTKHPTNQKGPASTAFQSAHELQCSFDDVLHPANWMQIQTASVDPLGVLREAILSGSEYLHLLTACQDILLESATLKLDLTIIDTIHSAHELQNLIFAWENHMKLRLWRREVEPWRPGRNLQEALRGIKSSCRDLTGVLRDDVVVDTGLMIGKRVINNYERSFTRLAQSTNLMFPLLALTPKTRLTILQRRIEIVVRSGRQVQGVANSLRDSPRKSSISRPQVQDLLPRPTKQRAARHNKSLFQQVTRSMSTLQSKADVTSETRFKPHPQLGKESTGSGKRKRVRDLVIFFRDSAKQQAVLKILRSFEQVSTLAKELQLHMDCTKRLIPLRKPLENVVMSGRQIQGIADALRPPMRTQGPQNYETWFRHVADFELKLRLGTDATIETRLALRKPLEDVIKSGRQLQRLTDFFLKLGMRARQVKGPATRELDRRRRRQMRRTQGQQCNPNIPHPRRALDSVVPAKIPARRWPRSPRYEIPTGSGVRFRYLVPNSMRRSHRLVRSSNEHSSQRIPSTYLRSQIRTSLHLGDSDPHN